MEPYIVEYQNAHKIHEWLLTRQGILIWKSIDLSDPEASTTTPYLDKDGKVNEKPHWKFGNEPDRHITSISDVVVSIPKEYKRFHVGTRMGSNGLSFKVTDAGSRRIRLELEKAFNKTGKAAFYVFDYMDEKNCVIMIDDSVIPLQEFIDEKESIKTKV